MHARVQHFPRLGVHRTLANEAAERRLDVAAGAAEPIVEIEVAESGVEIIVEHQADYPAPEPYAFRIGRRPAKDADGFCKFVDFLLVFGRLARARFLLRGLLVTALAKGRHIGQPKQGNAEQRRKITPTEKAHGLVCRVRLMSPGHYNTRIGSGLRPAMVAGIWMTQSTCLCPACLVAPVMPRLAARTLTDKSTC